MCPRGLSELAPAHTPVASAPTAVIPPSARAAASGVHPRRAPISLSPALLVHLSSPHTATHPLPFHVRATRRSGSSTFSDRSARRATAPRGTPSGTTRGRPTRSHWRRCALPAPTDALVVVSVRPPYACRRARGGVRAPSLRRPRRSRWCPCALPAPAEALAVASVRPPCAGRGARGGVRAPSMRTASTFFLLPRVGPVFSVGAHVPPPTWSRWCRGAPPVPAESESSCCRVWAP